MRLRLALLLTLALGAMAFPTMTLADNSCDSGEFCVWSEANYTGGDFWDPATDDPDWNWWGIENDDNSVKNKESVIVEVYPNGAYGGTLRYCTAPGEVEDDIADDRDDDGDSNLTYDGTGVTSCGTKPRP